jgi:PAS domain S-box-containing protein
MKFLQINVADSETANHSVEIAYRLGFTRIMQLIGVPILFLYSFFFYRDQLYFAGSMVVICALSMIIAFILGLRKYAPRKSTLVYRLITITFFVPMLLHHINLIGLNGRMDYLGWVFIYPLLTFFAFGEKEGMLWALLALAGIAIAFAISDLNMLDIARINSLKLQSLIAFVCIAAMALIYEIVRRNTHTILLSKHAMLKESEARYRKANQDLTHEISERKRAETELHKIQQELEHRVEMRTAELADANEELQAEIAQRKRIEKALRQSENKYRQIVENAPTGIYEIDLVDFRFTEVNDVMCAILGYTREELLSIDPRTLMTAETQLMVDDRMARVFAGQEVSTTFEYKITTKGGQELWVLLNAKAFHEDGKPARALTFAQDITEIKQLEAQLQQAQKMEAIGTLAGGIAHDFNNLLMTIEGNVSLLLFELDVAHPNYKILRKIENSVKSGAELTRQLLGYARKGKYQVTTIDLNRLVSEASDTFGRMRKDITIRRSLAEGLHNILADSGQIEQILLNLQVNAADAMPGGGSLSLTTENVTHEAIDSKIYEPVPGEYIRLTVADTGVGMDKDTQERIFEPFFTTKKMGRGTGLGLASVYGIVKSHNGYIEVESNQDRGTTFSVFLPATKNKVPKTVETNDRVAKGTGTILLVDDEEMVLDVCKRVLERIGFEVLEARNGKEAVEMYKNNLARIRLVILDMIMPEMGGGQAFDELKKINPEIKVLLSSGFSLDSKAAEILKRGCAGFIQKPFNLKDLSAKLEAILA